MMAPFTTALRPCFSRISAFNPRTFASSLRNTHTDAKTDFGFQIVREKDKDRLVSKVFSNVAPSYDIMNDVMSAGIHRCWKKLLIHRLNPGLDTQLLDVAGGTGDIALRFLNHVRRQGSLGNAHVTVLDVNPDMLRHGQHRFDMLGDEKNHVSFVQGNAEHLTGIHDNSVDAYTIAFGIRNCTHIDRVISEAYRVLKLGGRFLVLEFGKVDNPILSTIYDQYSFRIIPHLGQIIANDRPSYQYLVESIRKFPSQPKFASMIKSAGFQVVGQGYENLTFGVACIWSGWKL